MWIPLTSNALKTLALLPGTKAGLILLVMSSKRQIGRARVFHLQNHGHVTIENDFPAV